jgi:hypothetical protein
VLLQDGVLRGGDSTSYYVGKYRMNGNALTAELTASPHTDKPSGASLFAMDNVNITLSGRFSGPRASLTGKAAEMPGLTLRANLVRVGR